MDDRGRSRVDHQIQDYAYINNTINPITPVCIKAPSIADTSLFHKTDSVQFPDIVIIYFTS